MDSIKTDNVLKELYHKNINDVFILAKALNVSTNNKRRMFEDCAYKISVNNKLKHSNKLHPFSRLELAKDILSNKVEIFKCNLDKYTKLLYSMDGGMSGSEIKIVTIGALMDLNVTVAIKASPPYSKDIDKSIEKLKTIKNKSDDTIELLRKLHSYKGLQFEYLIYKYFITWMLENMITPNLPYYYGALVCKEDNDEYVQYLFMENMEGIELFEYLSENSEIDWVSILFQILYTLECLHELGINHNDLHLANIFVVTNINDTIRYFVDKNTHYTIPINGNLIKLFDFDLGSVDCNYALTHNKSEQFRERVRLFKKELGKDDCSNEKLSNDLYSNLGVTNKTNPTFDTFVFMCELLEMANSVGFKIPSNVTKFIYDVYGVTPDKNVLEYREEQGFPCRIPDIEQKFRDSQGKPLYKPIKEILKMDFFKKYRNTKDKYQGETFELPYLIH